jgi:hypothetical protein
VCGCTGGVPRTIIFNHPIIYYIRALHLFTIVLCVILNKYIFPEKLIALRRTLIERSASSVETRRAATVYAGETLALTVNPVLVSIVIAGERLRIHPHRGYEIQYRSVTASDQCRRGIYADVFLPNLLFTVRLCAPHPDRPAVRCIQESGDFYFLDLRWM